MIKSMDGSMKPSLWALGSNIGLTEDMPGFRMGSTGTPCMAIRPIMDLDLDDAFVLDTDFGGGVTRDLMQNVIEARGYKGADLDNVWIATSGSHMAVHYALKLILNEGGEMITDVPAWTQFALWNHDTNKYDVCPNVEFKGKVEAKFLYRHLENGWRYPLEELKEAVSKKTKLITLVNPGHNPSGVTEPNSVLKAIVEIAEDNDAWFLHDEIYRGLEHDKPFSSESAFNLDYEKAVCTSSVSKDLGLEGFRLGWLVARDKEFVGKLAQLHRMYGHGSRATIMMMIGRAAMEPENYKKLLDDRRQYMLRSMAVYMNFMARHEDVFTYVKPDCANLFLARLDLDMDSWDWSERLIKEKRVMTIPGEEMYGYAHYVRTGVGKTTPLKVIDACQLLDEFLDELEDEGVPHKRWEGEPANSWKKVGWLS
jgi:aspartate/methionine/tyrosine aminotransferase